jgi:L-iditol 2-dehydrogenase
MTTMSVQKDTMQALMFTAIRKLELMEVPVPVVRNPHDVLLKVKSVGICGSDLHGYTGSTGRRTPPLIMGHEVTAEVVSTGSAANDFVPGTRVAVQPIEFCGVCSQCTAGYRSLCENRRLIGMHLPGAYAEYVLSNSANLYRLSDALTYEHGALAEPLSIAVHAVGLVHFRPYDTVYIVGAGPIGLLTLAVLKQMGIHRIFVSDTSEVRLDTAKRLGADVLINPIQQDPLPLVKQYTNGRGVDVAFEAVGISATAQQAVDVTRTRGTVVWIGNSQKMIEVNMQSIVTREITLLGSYGMTDEEFQRSLQMLADGSIPAEQLINRRAELNEGPELFDQLLAEPQTIKCVFNLNDE